MGLSESPQLQQTILTTVNGLMLFYLALAMPYEDGLQNVLEIVNELCLYFTLLVLMALSTFSAQIHSSKLDSLGDWINLIICLTILFNLCVMIYALYQPFKESLNDRESTGVGRCLRYYCRIKLPESRKCFCDCCTCGDEAREVVSEYPRSDFFSLQPFACGEAVTSEAMDYEESEWEYYSEEEELSKLEISEDEDSEEDEEEEE